MGTTNAMASSMRAVARIADGGRALLLDDDIGFIAATKSILGMFVSRLAYDASLNADYLAKRSHVRYLSLVSPFYPLFSSNSSPTCVHTRSTPTHAIASLRPTPHTTKHPVRLCRSGGSAHSTRRAPTACCPCRHTHRRRPIHRRAQAHAIGSASPRLAHALGPCDQILPPLTLCLIRHHHICHVRPPHHAHTNREPET